MTWQRYNIKKKKQNVRTGILCSNIAALQWVTTGYTHVVVRHWCIEHHAFQGRLAQQRSLTYLPYVHD